MNHNWYLAPVIVDGNGYVQVSSNGAVYTPPMMLAHIGRTEDSPTQCLVGIRKAYDGGPPGDWTPVAPENFTSTFNTLFGRDPVASEQYPG